MKKIISICNILILLFTITSCTNLEEYYYYYDGKAYTSHCKYGSLGVHWEFPNYDEIQWEEITVCAEWGEEKARKIKDDEKVDFIYIHDMLCVRTDLQLPDIENNKEDISKINIIFHDTYDKMAIVDRNEIDYLSELILKSDNNTKSSKDYFYEYIGDIDVFYNDFPVVFSVARILKDKKGNLFLSGRSNPYVKGEIFTSLYSVPFEIPFDLEK